jgi:RNA polymerase sigma factor (sigma-70 family)
MATTDIEHGQTIPTEKLLASFLPLISRTVRWACHCYHRFPDQGVIDDLAQEIALLLIRNDYRNPRSFKHRSVEKTWLQIIVLHHVGRYFKNQKLTDPLEDALLNSLWEPPDQERKVLFSERKRLVGNARSELSEREQELWDLLCKGLSDEEIAKRMGIKVRSVQRKKHAVLKKIRLFMEHQGS